MERAEEAIWTCMGARLSGRALSFLVARALHPREAARWNRERWMSEGLDERDLLHLQAAVGEAARGVRAGLGMAEHTGPGKGERDGAETVERGGPATTGRLIHALHPEYPAFFLRLDHPPAAIRVAGDWRPSASRVAMVGARRAGRPGREFARSLAAELASSGIEVWSGLARGIDTAAHEGALSCGRTVAVLGSGLDRIYPAENRRLARAMEASGAIVTEFPDGTPPLRDHFPRRNRLLAAAADALVVIEAGSRSGALITVNWALALGIPVLVAPGDPWSESARGSNALLRAGAEWLLGAGDVLRALGRAPREGARARKSGPPAKGLTALLDGRVLHRDEVQLLWEGPGDLAEEILRLELEGKVELLPGGFLASRSDRS